MIAPAFLPHALLLGCLCGCASSHASGSSVPDEPEESGPASAEPMTDPPARPTKRLDRKQAARYVLDLVNHDRGKEGLPPVVWDDKAAKAATRHVEDMTENGFTGHIGTDGSVPELRYSEAGGEHMVMENAGCLADGERRPLDPDPRFSAESLEKIERAFIEERPPSDGHRRNILTAWHTSLGVGLAKPKAPAKFAGVGIARIDKPKPTKPKDIMKEHSYSIPKPFETYFPRGFKTPIPVDVQGEHFSIQIPMTQGGQHGVYEVSVWASVPQTKELVMISLRTIAAD
jgi:uncharacterized protein YkwD